ncbi:MULTISPECIES: helix-turn-helix domain-containing protein [Streptomyces]|uniref:DNA-binding protein n=1 Tax=Streptomyces cacaoi TaxID=1898 RepID=A0A4Y3R3P4_STRCI|nr:MULTISPECIES: XRE family transcriptional regulator [Streptomyces]NNG87999.1 helix-turn-helix transcriptional regulator [Streptomyces cacaoi]GEB52134.1 DNA-binding protein [Streptomyces cacaoi]
MSPTQPPPGGAEPDPGELPVFAPRMRNLRRRSGLSLEAAAHRAGLSPAHLSRLETGKRQPSLPLLLTLARTYGTTVGELLGEHPTAADPVIRADDMEPVDAGGWRYRQAGQAGRAMQALRVHVPRGPQRELVRVHPGEEWIHVQRGALRLTLGETVEVLRPGDSAHFDSLTPHRLEAADAQGADLLFVHTLLQSPAADLCVTGLPRHGPAGR